MRANLAVVLHRSEIISDNARMHWATRAGMVKILRTKAKFQAFADRTLLPTITEWPVRVEVTYQYPTRKRPTDANNLAATTKALVDGLTDSGLLWPDDNISFVVGQDSRINPSPSGDRHGLVRAVINIFREDKR